MPGRYATSDAGRRSTFWVSTIIDQMPLSPIYSVKADNYTIADVEQDVITV